MEICLHAGLHKSGTTTVQAAFASAFGERGRVWYPGMGHPAIVHHASLVWPLVGATRTHPHFDATVNSRMGGPPTFADAVRQAESAGVEKLVISCETFDQLRDDDVDALREACLGHPVRVVFTVTPPLHRWASLWQELVRHGLGAAPRPAEQILVETTLLRRGSLRGLIERFPAATKCVRLVSRSRVDESLVASVADLMDLDVELPPDPPALNESLGADAALIAHLNGVGKASGVYSPKDRETVAKWRAEAGGRRVDDFSERDFAIPDGVADAARDERDFLLAAAQRGSIVLGGAVDDLDRWDEVGLPAWYEEIRADSTGPGGLLQDPAIVDAQWTHAARLYSAVASLGATRLVEGELREATHHLRSELDRTGETLRATRQELRTIRRSRTWRWATRIRRPLGPLVGLLRRQQA